MPHVDARSFFELEEIVALLEVDDKLFFDQLVESPRNFVDGVLGGKNFGKLFLRRRKKFKLFKHVNQRDCLDDFCGKRRDVRFAQDFVRRQKDFVNLVAVKFTSENRREVIKNFIGRYQREVVAVFAQESRQRRNPFGGKKREQRPFVLSDALGQPRQNERRHGMQREATFDNLRDGFRLVSEDVGCQTFFAQSFEFGGVTGKKTFPQRRVVPNDFGNKIAGLRKVVGHAHVKKSV